MERNVLWRPWDDSGIEHLRLIEGDDGSVADSVLIRVFDGTPVRMNYEIRVDAGWRVRSADIDLWNPEHRRLSLRSDGNGRWSDGADNPLPDLFGCVDIDLTATAFTNTLPIRRLGPKPGEADVIDVAFIRIPALTVESVKQRYTCLERHASGARYRYEGLATGFRAELDVDDAGLVLDYPGDFRRIPLE